MRRGEIWTAEGGGHAGKPRPSLIVQADEYALNSVAICGFTSDPAIADSMRIPVQPSATNGLMQPSSIMIDKIVTVTRTNIVTHIGVLEEVTLRSVDRALLLFLGLASRR